MVTYPHVIIFWHEILSQRKKILNSLNKIFRARGHLDFAILVPKWVCPHSKKNFFFHVQGPLVIGNHMPWIQFGGFFRSHKKVKICVLITKNSIFSYICPSKTDLMHLVGSGKASITTTWLLRDHMAHLGLKKGRILDFGSLLPSKYGSDAWLHSIIQLFWAIKWYFYMKICSFDEVQW